MSSDNLIAFRKKVGDAVWHWCRTCPAWPPYDSSVEVVTPPPLDERCPECLLIADVFADCQPNPA
jgi:hypothetical protein